jgi:thiamine kinase-like enzyme
MTKDLSPGSSRFIDQIKDRTQAVFRMHPEFQTHNLAIGKLILPSFEDLLDQVEKATPDLTAPLSVLIHGDLNLNNIIYNLEEQRVHLIDLHRSRMTDYVQDISVFMVSNFRLPIFEKGMRERASKAIEAIYLFGRKFARTNGDETYEARLCLGLARSLFTSTRFEMNRTFANNMYLRSIYLMEKLMNHSDQGWLDFKLPKQALSY